MCSCLFANELDSVYTVLITFTPSVRIRMGQLLRSSMELMKSIAIKKDDARMTQAMTNSLAVHDTEFKHQVGHRAAMEQEKDKFMGTTTSCHSAKTSNYWDNIWRMNVNDALIITSQESKIRSGHRKFWQAGWCFSIKDVVASL